MRRGLFALTLSAAMLAAVTGWAAELQPGSDWFGALQALARLAPQYPDLRYAVIGQGDHQPVLQSLVGGLGLENRVRFLTDVSDDDLPGLYHIADLSELWVLAEVYEYEVGRIDTAGLARLQVEGFANAVELRIDYIYPTVDPATRTVRVRLLLPNRDGRYRPQGFATVDLPTVAAEVLSDALARDALDAGVLGAELADRVVGECVRHRLEPLPAARLTALRRHLRIVALSVQEGVIERIVYYRFPLAASPHMCLTISSAKPEVEAGMP